MIGNDRWESGATDVIGIHDYDANPRTCASATGPEMVTQPLVFDPSPAGGRI